MRLILSDVEPFNLPPVDNEQAPLFMQRLSGNEPFEFDGSVKPQSMLIYDLKYGHPGHSYAHGLLLSVGMDTLAEICSNSQDPEFGSILQKYALGKISIEYRGNLTTTRVTAQALLLE